MTCRPLLGQTPPTHLLVPFHPGLSLGTGFGGRPKTSARCGRRRFICREKIGAKMGEGAAWLVPVPPGAYVYGSGERTVILTKVRGLEGRAGRQGLEGEVVGARRGLGGGCAGARGRRRRRGGWEGSV